MTFALYPDDGKTPPRIWRRHASLAAANVVAALDPDNNILHINAPLFDLLSKDDQHRVLRTHETILYASGLGDPMPTIDWPKSPRLAERDHKTSTTTHRKMETFYAL